MKIHYPGLYQKRGVWYYQPPMDRGVRAKAISLRTKDRDAALAKYSDLRQAGDLEMRAGALEVEIERYLRQKLTSGQHTPISSGDARARLADLVALLPPALAVGEVSVADLRRYQRSLEDSGLAAATIAGYLSRVSGFFTWAVREGLATRNPVHALSINRRLPTKSEQYCLREERQMLISTAGRDDLAFILWMGFYAGLRIREIVAARRSWVDLPGGTITVQRTVDFLPKGKRARMVRLSPALAGFLGGYIQRWEESGPVSDYLLRPDKLPANKTSTSPRQLRYDPKRPFRLHVERQGLGWVGMHTLRHTFATLHAQAGTPLATIARELGDDLATTYRSYIGYSRAGGHEFAID